MRAITTASLCLCLGCGNTSRGPDGAVTHDGGDAGVPQLSDDWCARLAPGSAGAEPLPVALSEAHAAVRFFGPFDSYRTADSALADAVRPTAAFDEEPLVAYASSLAGVCARPAIEAPALPRSEVVFDGTRATIRPGEGTLAELPEGIDTVVIDTRALPTHAGTDEALRRAVAHALNAPLRGLVEEVRAFSGLPDEVWTAASGGRNVYSSSLQARRVDPIEAEATQERTLIVVTDEELSPSTALVAGWLRLSGRAWLVGRDVFASIAESSWLPVHTAGLAFRNRLLVYDGYVWPDRIPADLNTASPLEELSQLSGPPPAIAVRDGDAARPEIAPIDPNESYGRPAEMNLGIARAGLLITHGATRMFFPLFHRVGDTIDERLLETLQAVDEGDPTDRYLLERQLQRFANALHDAHSFAVDHAATAPRLLPVWIDQPDGVPFVRVSGAEGIEAGDTLLTIDGEAAEQWFANERRYVSAATEGNGAAQTWLRLRNTFRPSVDLRVRSADGTERTVSVSPSSERASLYEAEREHGRLSDLGADDIHYINLDGDYSGTGRDLMGQLRAARGAAGIVVDMRGYPGGDVSTEDTVARYDFLAALAGGSASSARFETPTYEGFGRSGVQLEQYNVEAREADVPAVPIVVLVSPGTQSAAEDYIIYVLSGDSNVRVVGRQSSGTNGNITGVSLPGGFAFTFTGMEVLFAAGEPFHGIGLIPDVEVRETAEDLRLGRDVALDEAIVQLQD